MDFFIASLSRAMTDRSMFLCRGVYKGELFWFTMWNTLQYSRSRVYNKRRVEGDREANNKIIRLHI